MALSAAVEYVIRPAGSNLNGGGFAKGAAGVDYSDRDTPQESYSTLACVGASTTLTCSAPDTFSADIVGNVIYVVSGTNFVAGWYEVITRTSGTSVVLDRTPTNGSNASLGVGNMGGSLAITVLQSTAFTNAINYFPANTNKTIWVKSGNHSITANAQPNFPNVSPSTKVKLIGYDTARGVMPEGDARPFIDAFTFTFWVQNNYTMLAGLRFATGNGFGIRLSNDYVVRNVKITSTSNWALFSGTDGVIDSCELEGPGTGSGTGNLRGITRKSVFRNFATGVTQGNVINCVFIACSTGVLLNAVNGSVIGSTFYTCGTGVNVSVQRNAVIDNIFDTCLVGIQASAGGLGMSLEPNLFNNCTENYSVGSDVGLSFTGLSTYANKVGDPGFVNPQVVGGDFRVTTGGAAWNYGLPTPNTEVEEP